MKTNTNNVLPIEIKPIRGGSPDTLLSASRANELVAVFNAVELFEAVPPLFIYKADGNFVFEYRRATPIPEQNVPDTTI